MSTFRPEWRQLPLPERIRTTRKAAGYTSQEALGAALGSTRFRVNAWETGHNAPNEENAEKLSELLGGDPSDWLAEDKASRRRGEAAFVRAAEDLVEAAEGVVRALDDLVPLLAQQEKLVVEMRTLVSQLSRLADAR